MQRTERGEFSERDPIRQPEFPVYMPATPTSSFLEYVELAVDAVIR
ncbi:hypothetical protein [Natrinema salaciae]|uniref:Uncharacterized protein n=1 Tax=Natrinema salaciae TaxID=1186196 RepID=A0A1H8ZU78_9EURY|nr:hypothetical protein [Natrinema salaciae]SEP67934.1 hypothetical protein SAMN04489841_0263 [Natrinema salaciae]